jgi:hypothetical protein
MGKGGQITVRANGQTISEGRLARSIPVQFSLGEGLDVGMDIGSPIDFTYKAPLAFTGRIEKAKIGLGPPQTAQWSLPSDALGIRIWQSRPAPLGGRVTHKTGPAKCGLSRGSTSGPEGSRPAR